MKRSRFLLNTLKETPKEAVVASHILLARAGMIKQVASGIYTYMPLATRVLHKIETIIREELDAAGCQELLMPVVQPAELWVESGRWQEYGKELLRLKDRKDNDYCLGPTHEEIITDVVRREVRSYKDLPLNLYQIQTKFRDEIRPRFGLMRGREFLMKDAYSFDVDTEAATASYWDMHRAYSRIFSRCKLEFRPVEADSGAIGGDYNHEFQVLARSGEDLVLSCGNCDYAANAERCEIKEAPAYEPAGAVADPRVVDTPGKKTIEEVAGFLGVAPEACVKTLLYQADGRLIAAMIPGHRELNEVALKRAAGAVSLEIAVDPALFANRGLHPGFLGPIDFPEDIPLYVDAAVMAAPETVAGANQPEKHLVGVVPAAHVKPTATATLRQAVEGDGCPRCGKGRFKAFRGIEVGHIFRLGTKYSESMNAVYLDQNGKERPIVMGCYGIGVGRTMAAAIEQNHDEDGIIWPVSIAPFHVMLLNLDVKDEQVLGAVDGLYAGLRAKGVETLVDDTPQRPGFKFKDADLIGLPVQATVGARSLKNGVVEIKIRRSGEKRAVPLGAAVDEIVAELQKLGWGSPLE